MNKEQIVDSVEDLYDEEILAQIHDINHRRWCWGHRWITASLEARWGSYRDGGHFSPLRKYSVRLCAHDWQHPERMQSLQQPIRFCRNCKRISCVHCLGDCVTYKVQLGEFYCRAYAIAPCLSCKTRLLVSGWGCFTPSSEGLQIVADVAAELGKDMQALPSGFHCELPIQVSALAKRDSTAAKAHARHALLCGVTASAH